MKHILIQPEYRWWLNETFIGSFFGVQAHFAQYNFGGTTPFTTVKNNRYQGNLIGCRRYLWTPMAAQHILES